MGDKICVGSLGVIRWAETRSVACDFNSAVIPPPDICERWHRSNAHDRLTDRTTPVNVCDWEPSRLTTSKRSRSAGERVGSLESDQDPNCRGRVSSPSWASARGRGRSAVETAIYFTPMGVRAARGRAKRGVNLQSKSVKSGAVWRRSRTMAASSFCLHRHSRSWKGCP